MCFNRVIIITLNAFWSNREKLTGILGKGPILIREISERCCVQFSRNTRNFRGMKFKTRMVFLKEDFKNGEFNNRQKMSGLSG